MSKKTGLARCMGLVFALACLVHTGAAATSPSGQDWKTETGVSPPSYAVTEPVQSSVNVDVIALVCGETAYGRTLELELYVAGPGPLLPNGADPQRLKDRPSVEIAVDGRSFRADLLFTDDYVVVADASDHMWPILSAHLLDAMQNGRSMVLRFDLLEDEREGTTEFDGQLVIDLRSGQSAIAAVRRCASPDSYTKAGGQGNANELQDDPGALR